jgi:predicted porin
MGAFTPYVKYGEHKYSGGTLGSVTNAKMTNVGVRYALSKRSLVYVDYVTNGAAMTNATSSSKSQASVGIQHNF